MNTIKGRWERGVHAPDLHHGGLPMWQFIVRGQPVADVIKMERGPNWTWEVDHRVARGQRGGVTANVTEAKRAALTALGIAPVKRAPRRTNRVSMRDYPQPKMEAVGRHLIYRDGDSWWVRSLDGPAIHRVTSRRAALALVRRLSKAPGFAEVPWDNPAKKIRVRWRPAVAWLQRRGATLFVGNKEVGRITWTPKSGWYWQAYTTKGPWFSDYTRTKPEARKRVEAALGLVPVPRKNAGR